LATRSRLGLGLLRVSPKGRFGMIRGRLLLLEVGHQILDHLIVVRLLRVLLLLVNELEHRRRVAVVDLGE